MRDHTINLRGGESEHPGPEAARPRKKFHSALKLTLVIIVVLFAAASLWSTVASGMAWRAVFLSNNQVYFGHFWDMPFASSITLRDVYYLQVAQPSQQLSGQDQSQLKLVKLGNEIHGPTSEMVIPLSQVLFSETLRPDSVIVKTIQNGQVQKTK